MTNVTFEKKKARRFSETAKNYWLDITLFIAFVVDMNVRFTGIPIHEWLGIAFGTALIYHLMLHWKWIVQITKRLFTQLPAKQRLRYIVDLLLFVDMVIVVITGIWISRVVAQQLNIPSLRTRYFDWLHETSAELAIILVGLHIALSWKWIATNTKKYILRL